MSNDGFKFQYREGDEVEYGDTLWVYVGRSTSGRFMRIKYGGHQHNAIDEHVKPINKTLERYEIELLAWINSTGWVEIISEPTEAFKIGEQYEVAHIGKTDGIYYVSVKGSTKNKSIDCLKPCDPPKPENIKEGQFELEGDSLIALKYMSCWGSVATHDGKPEVVFNAHGGRPVLHPDDLRSIASLLDRYQASIAPA